MPRIFLSHSSIDGRQATALKRWLVQHDPSLERQIFLDTDIKTGMRGGEQWTVTLHRNLASCQALLCLISKNWETSKECHHEYRGAEDRGKTIFCARLEPDAGLALISQFERRELYVESGHPVTTIELDDGGPPVDFSTDGLERLLRDVRSPHLGADSFTWPPPDQPRRAPYRGWQPLEAPDAAVYFGRDGELISALKTFDDMHTDQRGRLFVILGPSGTGKSSFLRAGLLPRLDLHRDRFTVFDIVRPGRGEALTGETGLAKAICATRQRLGLTTPTLGEIKAEWITDATKVSTLLRECRERAMELSNDDTVAPTMVVPVDQAEELFSAESGREAAVLLELIGELLASGESAESSGRPPVIVMATIRTDRYEVMQTANALNGVDTTLFNDLRPMRTDRFRQVIEGPARRCTEGGHPLTIDTALLDRLLSDAAANTSEGGDTLPLLSGTLARLYTDYGASGDLTVSQYEQMGGIDGVVETEINKILSPDRAARDAELTKLKEAFIPWLATVSDRDEPMRRIALWTDLPEASRELVEKFVDARILIRDTRELGEDGDGEQDVVEIALESLLKQWNELSGWLAEQAENLKAADVLLRDAERWRVNSFDEIYLYPRALLSQAEMLAATSTFGRKLEPTRKFLLASRQAVTDQQHEREAMLRRNTVRLASLLVITFVVAAVAVFAFFTARHAKEVANHNAQDATAQKLVSEANAMLAGTGKGGDRQAFEQLLAANRLAAHPNERPMLDALVRRSSTDLIRGFRFPVVGVAVADAKQRLAATDTKSVHVWDTADPNWHESLRGDGQSLPVPDKTLLTSLAMSADGQHLAAGTNDGVVLVWDLGEDPAAAKPIGAKHDGRVTAVAISRDGRQVASTGADGVIDMANFDGTGAHSIAVGTELFTVVFDPSGGRLAAGGSDGALRLWVLGELPAATDSAPADLTVPAHAGGVMSVAFSPKGDMVASGGADNTVRLWTGDTLRPIDSLKSPTGQGHTAPVTAVAFSPDGTRIASGSNDRTVALWDVASKRRIGDPMIGHQGLVLTVAFIANGNEVVSGGNEHALRLWNGVVGQPLSLPLIGHSGPVTNVAVSHDGRLIASAGVDGTTVVWNADTGARLANAPDPSGAITRVVFDGTGDTIASGSADGKLRLWNWKTGALTVLRAGRPISAIALNHDGNQLLSGGIDGQITIWEVPSGRRTDVANNDRSVVFDLAFDPQGDRFVAGSVTGKLRMFDNAGRQQWERDSGVSLPDTLSDGTQLADGHLAAVLSVAFSPDGQRVASGSSNWTADGGAIGLIRLWDATTGEPTGKSAQVGNAVMDLGFGTGAPDATGDRVIAASFDPYNVQLWDTGAGVDTFQYPLQVAQVVSVAVSADNGRIVSGSMDGTVRIWPNPPAMPADRALCQKLTTNLSEEDWRTSISPDIAYEPYKQICPELPPGQ